MKYSDFPEFSEPDKNRILEKIRRELLQTLSTRKKIGLNQGRLGISLVYRNIEEMRTAELALMIHVLDPRREVKYRARDIKTVVEQDFMTLAMILDHEDFQDVKWITGETALDEKIIRKFGFTPSPVKNFFTKIRLSVQTSSVQGKWCYGGTYAYMTRKDFIKKYKQF